MESSIKLSFIIVNYRSSRFIPTCIASIRKNANGIPFEIIIINNDNSNFYFPEIKIINLEKNLGFGQASNAGSKCAQGEILCFLNPDTEILSNIKSLIDFFKNDEKIGIVGGKIVDSTGKTEKWCAGFLTTFWNLIRNNLGFSKSQKIWNSPKEIECERVSGCDLFIRKSLFNALNGFDEKFFMYFEDEDLCQRARTRGLKVFYFPAFHVKHFGGKSFKNKFRQKKTYYTSLIRYLYKRAETRLSKEVNAWHL